MLYAPPGGQNLTLKLWEGGYAAPAGDSLAVDLAPLPTAYGFATLTFGRPFLVVDSGWMATSFGVPIASFYQSGQATGIYGTQFGDHSNLITQPVVGQIATPASFGTPLFPLGTLLGWSSTAFGFPLAHPVVVAASEHLLISPTFGEARVFSTGRVASTPPYARFGTPAFNAGSSWLATQFGTPHRVTYANAEVFAGQPLFGTPTFSTHHSVYSIGAIARLGLANSPGLQTCVTQGIFESVLGRPSANRIFTAAAVPTAAIFGSHEALRRQQASPLISSLFGAPSVRRVQQAASFRSGAFGYAEKVYVDTFAQRNWDTVVVFTRQHEVIVR